VEEVILPDHLRTHPFLLEHYGTVEWSVRNIFGGYLGWFNGDAAFLSPAPNAERAAEIISLAGGVPQTMTALREASANGQHRWAAELATYVLEVDAGLSEARQIKATSLRQLGYASTSPAGRNYYLTQALELEGNPLPGEEAGSASASNVVEAFPIRSILASLQVRLNPEKALEEEMLVGFRFTNTGESFTMEVRNGIIDLRDGFPEDPDVAIATETTTFFEILTQQRSLPLAIATFKLRVTTGALTVPKFIQFLLLFRDDEAAAE